MNAKLLDSRPPGSIAACYKAGWIQKDSFTQRLKYFIGFVKQFKKDPVILALDGQYSHSRNKEVIQCARENWVPTVCRPPHSIHKL
jgi:transposase